MRRILSGALIIFIYYFITYTYDYVPIHYKFYVAFAGGLIFKSIISFIRKGLRIL